jgi:hypothetical protein
VRLDSDATRAAARICATLLALFVVAGARPAFALLYVDDDDPSCGGLQPCFSTVQGAILSASDGETVEVRLPELIEDDFGA